MRLGWVAFGVLVCDGKVVRHTLFWRLAEPTNKQLYPRAYTYHLPLASSSYTSYTLSDVRVERQRSADAAAGYSHKLQSLQQQLDQERSAKASALLQQQEAFQQQKHQLQALLAEAEDQLERQRRELSAGFLLQVGEAGDA